MADNESKSGSLLNWIGGIAATVIASVIVFYVTRQPTPPTPPAPIVLPQVGLNGFVADVVSQKPIPDALVTVDLGPKLATQTTDTQGRYSFIMDGTTAQSQTQTVSVDILASGYLRYATTVNVLPGDNFAELMIEPVPTTAPQQPHTPPPFNGAALGARPAAPVPHPASPLPQPTAPPQPKHATLILRAPTHYIQRTDATPLKSKPN